MVNNNKLLLILPSWNIPTLYFRWSIVNNLVNRKHPLLFRFCGKTKLTEINTLVLNFFFRLIKSIMKMTPLLHTDDASLRKVRKKVKYLVIRNGAACMPVSLSSVIHVTDHTIRFPWKCQWFWFIKLQAVFSSRMDVTTASRHIRLHGIFCVSGDWYLDETISYLIKSCLFIQLSRTFLFEYILKTVSLYIS